MSKVLMFVGTTGSNKMLADQIAEVFSEEGVDVESIHLEQEGLPLFTPARQKKGAPDCVMKITQKAKEASGFVFVGPEYNGSIPPVFNNALAWISTSGGSDWRVAFNGKIAALATSSGGPGFKYQTAMTQQLNHIGAIVLPRMISVTGSKPFKKESAQAIIKQLISRLL